MAKAFGIKKYKEICCNWYVLVLLFVLGYLIQRLPTFVPKISVNSFTMDDGSVSIWNGIELKRVDDGSSCAGKYIYIHHLPSRFNVDILKDCSSILKWRNMCKYISNFGMGPIALNLENTIQDKGWFATDQFLLEVIFHNKLKRYKCLTNNYASATAIFVPFYAGLDVSRFVLGSSNFQRDDNSIRLANWIVKTAEWKRRQGRDHFSTLGRISIDFRRESEDRWGSKLLLLPEFNNMTFLDIESDSRSTNEFAIPYPTYFHPSSDKEIIEWQEKVRKMDRPYLYTFVGCRRPNISTSIRDQIIQQCISSFPRCQLLDCKTSDCTNPVSIMKMFKKSVFCLQPAGDSYTRRSTFDSILAGCIPVFFHPNSAYTQYVWHLPNNNTKYSVLISEEALRNKNVRIEEILKEIPEYEVEIMRKEVIRLIPKIIYADPRSSLETLEDAFDIAVQKVIQIINNKI
ncbi:xyloglucan galactosyltransferase MUR3-like [Apium graveolens]|uniref:xyloglucan galactosyltransferase MUR3-like n=1 Tax=Apium graveolens TaxID=4045 RepID=UPI003D7BC846